VIAPQAAGPPRCSCATTGPSTENAPYQAIITTQNWATMTHSHVCERNSDQPSRSSVSMPGAGGAASPGRASVPVTSFVPRMASSIGTVATMPAPHRTRAQPAPVAATSRPATAAPDIWPLFMASRLIALASCSRRSGTSRGSSACEAG